MSVQLFPEANKNLPLPRKIPLPPFSKGESKLLKKESKRETRFPPFTKRDSRPRRTRLGREGGFSTNVGKIE